MKSLGKLVCFFSVIISIFCYALPVSAATYSGTNSPGQYTEFSISISTAAGENALRLTVPKSGNVASHILLKFGSPLTSNSDYQYSSRLDSADNILDLDIPALETGTWYVRVLTPAAASGPHNFTLFKDTGAAARPVTQPDTFTQLNGSLNSGDDIYYRIVPSQPQNGWRIVLSATASSNMTLRAGSPTDGTVVASSSSQTLHTLLIAPESLTAGTSYYLQVHANAATTFKLTSDPHYFRSLTWDSGTNLNGSSIMTQPDTSGGDYIFKVTTQVSVYGAWRTALKVTTGEADVYMQQGSAPTGNGSYSSSRVGDDGFVLSASRFSNNQEWYIRVHATPDATWNLISGDIYVQDLGTVADTATSSGALVIGPEGMSFFKADIDAATQAWRLWLNGSSLPLYVKKAVAPVKNIWEEVAEQTENGQMLLVPPYLTNALYLIGVTGNPGDALTLESRKQQVTSLSFASSTSNTIAGYGYTTYRVEVPIDQIAWQINLTPGSAGQNPELYIRSGNIPNRWTNSALSEAAAGVIDSITQVPPTLTDGTWYITVYGSGSFSYTLTNNIPVVTGKPFINTSDPNPVPPDYAYPYNTVPITNDDSNRSGWRYYQVSDINSQLGFLGWQLDLDGVHQAGREIALRRNAVPARWSYRTGNSAYSTGVSEAYHLDATSNYGFLQRPGHQADIWYIGINTPNQAMGPFELTTREIPAPPVQVNSSTSTVSSQIANTWQWFRFTVPSSTDSNNAAYEPNFLGWDLRLKATVGNPRMVVRRDQLPANFNSNASDGSQLFMKNTWPTGWQWAPGIGDQGTYGNGFGGPTGRYNGDKDSYLIVGMGTPLEAGTYYVGISGNGSDTTALSYSLESRGIGIGTDAGATPWPIQVQDLGNFAGGSVNGSNLAPREAAYYRVTVPAGAKSWSVKLEPTLGEALMEMRQGALPNMLAITGATSDSTYYAGTRRQKGGREFFYKYAVNPQTTITAGTYYIAVIGEGQNPPNDYTIGTGGVSYTLTSIGEMPVADKTATPVAVATPVTWNGEGLQYGQQKVYRFRVPAGLTSMEVRLKNVVGAPVMALRQDAAGSGMIPSQGYLEYVPYEGGYYYQLTNNTLITIPQPVAGDYTLAVADRQIGATYPDAAYDVEVTAQGLTPLPFTNSTIPVTSQDANSWRFFQVDVPAGALGWDLRLKATVGNPRMVVRRDQLPANFNSNASDGSQLFMKNTWPTGWQWAPGIGDQGTYGNGFGGPTGRYNGDKDSYLIVGMGTPLEAGTYYVGISGNGSDTTALSYSLESRGIGIGTDAGATPWPIQVQDLGNFAGGSVNGSNLAPREAAYYRVTVPAGAKSWSVKLEPTLGEALMEMRQGALPNMLAITGATSDSTYYAGTRRQKGGREFFYKYAVNPQTTITAGTYYIAVIGEGQNPPNDYTIGTGGVSYTLTSIGEMPVADKTATPVAVATPVTWNGEGLQYGQQKVYRFRVPAGLTSMEVRLKNVVGAPVMALRQDAAGSGMIPTQGYLEYVPYEGGYYYQWNDATLITIPQPVAGDYTLAVADRQIGATYPDAAYDVGVTAQTATPLILDNGSASGSLIDKQIHYYQVIIPATVNGYPLAGWKIGTVATNGTAKLYISKNGVPNASSQPTLIVTSPFAVLTAPYLEPGTWYIAVQGVGITDYSIISEVISADPAKNRRSWSMTARTGSFTQAGLTAPWFGDSGIDNAGNPIINPSTGDQGTDLGKDDWHFYRITIPDANGGILKTMVEALSGKPELYIRQGSVPSIYHADNAIDPIYTWYSNNKLAYDRSQTLTGTMYGNWVPLDRRKETKLAQGDWWLGIKAVNSNIRYRLKVAAGNVRDANGPLDGSGYFQDLDLTSGSKTGQILAAGDIRYYRVVIPQSSTTQASSTPTSWNLTMTQQVGDVGIIIRDTIPPGIGTDGNNNYLPNFMSWAGDNSYLNPNPYITIDDPGTTTISTPPLRPGATYYVGVYAKTDATFDLSSSVGAERLKLDGIISSGNGTITTTLAAGEVKIYRIDVPVNAVYWQHFAQHDAGILLYIAQGTVPPLDGYAHWQSYGAANSSLNTTMGTYPWQAGYSYYLVVKNTTAGQLPFIFAQEPVSGSCGTSNGTNVSSTPTANLCATGVASPVSGTGPWNWSCFGQNGGANAGCSANPNNWSVSITMAGPGNGTVNSDPAGITCISGSSSGCTASFQSGTVVNLIPTPSTSSLFGGWSIGCNGTGACSITLDAATGVTAFFTSNNKLKLSGATTTHASLQEAYTVANDGETFLMQVYSFIGNLDFNLPKHVKLKGGLDSSYSSKVGVTTILGTLTIEQGSVEVSDVVIW